MENEAGADRPRIEMPLAQGCRLFMVIFFVLILFFLIACIMILLIVLNRSGRFALLSASFGAALYCTVTIPNVLFALRKFSQAQRQPGDSAARMPASRITRQPTTVRSALAGLLLFSLLGATAFVGLYFLPGQGLVFALATGALGLAFFFSLLQVSALVFNLVLIRRGRARNYSGTT
jgi:hypothetical protein